MAHLPIFSPTNFSSLTVSYLNHQAAFLLENVIGLLLPNNCDADATSSLLWFDLQPLLCQFAGNYFDSLGSISFLLCWPLLLTFHFHSGSVS